MASFQSKSNKVDRLYKRKLYWCFKKILQRSSIKRFNRRRKARCSRLPGKSH